MNMSSGCNLTLMALGRTSSRGITGINAWKLSSGVEVSHNPPTNATPLDEFFIKVINTDDSVGGSFICCTLLRIIIKITPRRTWDRPEPDFSWIARFMRGWFQTNRFVGIYNDKYLVILYEIL